MIQPLCNGSGFEVIRLDFVELADVLISQGIHARLKIVIENDVIRQR
jgi:hypothetical protein